MIELNVPAALAAVNAASEGLVRSVAGLDDTSIAGPSALPGWNRAMLVTHLARNAEGFAGMYRGAQRSEVVHLYPHGRDGRNADIEAGRRRSAAEALADLTAAVAAWAAASDELTDAEWERLGTTFSGDHPIWTTLPVRRREVEVHHMDLSLGYRAADWPPDFVGFELALAVEGLPTRLTPGTDLQLVANDGMGEWTVSAPHDPGRSGGRSDRVEAPGHQLLAWLLGRESVVSDGPKLGPW